MYNGAALFMECGYSSFGRALVFQTGGGGFKSRYPLEFVMGTERMPRHSLKRTYKNERL
jgi:hypothetical protein